MFEFLHTAPRVLVLAAAVLAGNAAAQAQPKLEAAWARPTVAGQQAGGGYVTITGGAVADRLLGARSAVARSVELHEMTMAGTTMRMRAVDAVAVPAGQTVELKPGGLHVMFMGLTQPLKPGERFPLTLRFEKAGELTVTMQVATAAPAPAAGGHKH